MYMVVRASGNGLDITYVQVAVLSGYLYIV